MSERSELVRTSVLYGVAGSRLTQFCSRVFFRYKQNRCAMFDSKRLHETAKYNFKEGFKDRRINLTLLFGWKGDENIELVNNLAAI